MAHIYDFISYAYHRTIYKPFLKHEIIQHFSNHKIYTPYQWYWSMGRLVRLVSHRIALAMIYLLQVTFHFPRYITIDNFIYIRFRNATFTLKCWFCHVYRYYDLTVESTNGCSESSSHNLWFILTHVFWCIQSASAHCM